MPEREESGVLDAGNVLSKKAYSLFNKKDYDSALETYGEALNKFLLALNNASGDASLAKSIENNIISSRKNILVCKFAIGIGVSEAAKSAFDGDKYEDAKRLYNKAVVHFEKALKDAQGLEDTDEINKMQILISETKSNINSCYIAADKIKVEELSKQASTLIEEAVKFREDMELSKARNNLKTAESIIEEAFDIATKREFGDAQQILNMFLKNVREERNAVDDLQLKPVECVEVDKHESSQVIPTKPDIKSPTTKKSWEPPILEPEPAQLNPIASPASVQSSAIPVIASAFGHKGATIQYKVKVENSTSEPIADIKINLYVPDVFLASESTKSIAMLKPSESKTVTFEIRPTGECGNCEVSGKVVYYDYSTKKTTGIDIPAKSLSIVCPMLKMKEISESQWHSIVSNLIETEESTKEIDMPAEALFTMVSRIVKDMHMHPLNPEITNSQQLFNGVACFYGEGVKGLKYAAQVEVVGGAKKSRLILKTWAEKEEALTGFYHGLLDEIEKRVQVKGYIDDSIVQNFYHYGDKIGTQVKDSIVQRSNIGAGADVGAGGNVAENKCPTCGTVAEGNGKFCNGCGGKL